MDRVEATIHNISRGGVQIQAEEALSVGVTLGMTLPLEGDDARFKGTVVYVQSLAEGRSLAGVRFSEISDQDSRLLKRFLDHHSLKAT